MYRATSARVERSAMDMSMVTAMLKALVGRSLR